MMAKETEEKLFVRPRRVFYMCVPLAVLLVAVFVTVAVLLRGSDTGVIFQVSDQVAMIGIGVLLAAGTLLFTLSTVKADENGIVVRNLLRVRHFTWTEVLSITFPDGASYARLELPDDEYHSVLAVQAVDREHAVEAVRALRRLHRRFRD